MYRICGRTLFLFHLHQILGVSVMCQLWPESTSLLSDQSDPKKKNSWSKNVSAAYKSFKTNTATLQIHCRHHERVQTDSSLTSQVYFMEDRSCRKQKEINKNKHINENAIKMQETKTKNECGQRKIFIKWCIKGDINWYFHFNCFSIYLTLY